MKFMFITPSMLMGRPVMTTGWVSRRHFCKGFRLRKKAGRSVIITIANGSAPMRTPNAWSGRKEAGTKPPPNPPADVNRTCYPGA